jgi:two-component SAPR family response regulator
VPPWVSRLSDSLSILLLEDDEDLRTLVGFELEDANHKVTAVGAGIEAVSAIERQAFELAIIDIRMKGISGLEALAKMREFQSDLPCIVITGYASQEDASRAAQLGVRGYLNKPFKMSELLDKVSQIGRELRKKSVAEATEQQFAQFMEWTLERLLVSASSPELRKQFDQAMALADNSGLPPLQVKEIQLLVALRAGKLEPPVYLESRFQSTYEYWDGSGPRGLKGADIPIEGRVVSLVLTESKEDCQEKFDPTLLALLNRLESNSSRSVWRHRRTLTGLGQALLSTGDKKGAAKAFETVLAEGEEGVEAVTAFLGLAEVRGSLELLERAVQSAARVGPAVAARTNLDVGARLLRSKPNVARKLFQRVLQLGPELFESKLAQLALQKSLASKDEKLLGEILEPGNRWLLEPHRHWMVPLLLTHLSKREAGADVVRFLLEHPNSVRKEIETGQIATADRLSLAQCLQSVEPDHPLVRLLEQDPEESVRRSVRLANASTGRIKFIPSLRVLALGQFEIQVGDKTIEKGAWRNKKARLILALILAHKGSLAEDVIIDIFWPEDYEKGKRGLYNALSLYRRLLKADSNESTEYVIRNGHQISINSEREVWHDADRCEELFLEIGRGQTLATILAAGRELMRLFRGPYLDGHYMDWILTKREDLEKRYLESLSRAADLANQQKAYREGLEFSMQVLSFDSCHQAACVQAMQGYTQLGRPEEAVRLFQKLEVALINELQIEPSTEAIRALHLAKMV